MHSAFYSAFSCFAMSDSSAFSVALVPGHSPARRGASARGLSEYPLTLVLVKMTHERLRAGAGVHPEIFHRGDGGLTALITDVNAAGVDLALSVHFNASDGVTSQHGYALCYPGSERGHRFARALTAEVPCPGGDRVKERTSRQLAFLSDTEAPAALDEPGFIDVSGRGRLLSCLDSIADGYARAVRAYARAVHAPRS